ncbi:MAG: hypothetical protein AABZ15_01045 [Nitrospirota bacterium]
MSTTVKTKKTNASWNDVKKALAGHGKTALLGLIADLYDYSAQNRNFLHARFSTGADPLKPYKKIIDDALFPDVMKNKPVRIADAKRAISDYKKAIGDQKGSLELMLFFVETGTAFTLDLGDMDENFYLALERMYKKAIDLLLTFDEDIVDAYYPRFEKLVSSSENIGWGYHDSLADIFYEAFPDEEESDH